MNDLENRTNEDLQEELERLEEKYVRNLTSKFDKNELNRIWERIKMLKDEIARRQNDKSD